MVQHDDGACVFSAEGPTLPFIERFVSCDENQGPGVIVLGDSHAMNIFNALARGRFDGFLAGIVKPSCRPQDNRPDCAYRQIEEFFRLNADRVRAVIFHQSGSHLIRDPQGQFDSNAAFARDHSYRIDGPSIEKLSGWLSRIGQLVPVIWLGPFVEARVDFRNIEYFIRNGFRINTRSPLVFADLERALRRFAAMEPQHYRYVSLLLP